MRVLLDECLPRRLKLELPDHEVRTVERLKGLAFAIVMLSAPSNDIDTLRPLMPEVRAILAAGLQPGDIVRVGPP